MKPDPLGDERSHCDWCDKASLLAALDKPAKVIVERVGFSCTLFLVSAEEGIALHFGVKKCVSLGFLSVSLIDDSEVRLSVALPQMTYILS